MNYLDLVRDVRTLIRAWLPTLDEIALGRVCRALAAERGPPHCPTPNDLARVIVRYGVMHPRPRHELVLKLRFCLLWMLFRPKPVYPLEATGRDHLVWDSLVRTPDFAFCAWVEARGYTVAKVSHHTAHVMRVPTVTPSLTPSFNAGCTLDEIAVRGASLNAPSYEEEVALHCQLAFLVFCLGHHTPPPYLMRVTDQVALGLYNALNVHVTDPTLKDWVRAHGFSMRPVKKDGFMIGTHSTKESMERPGL